MKNTIFNGVATALVTPMNNDGSVNYKKLEEFLEFQVESGVSAIVSCGTTGEGATLSNEEHVEVMKKTIDVINHRIPVIAGTGSNDTNYGIELSVKAQELGADGLLLVTPYYNKATQKGLIQHYSAIADSVNIPIILYNVPSRTGVAIKSQTYLELSKHKNIVAVKEANGDISSLFTSITLCGDSLDFYSGNDDQIIPFYSLGAKGVISVASNIIPKETVQICKLCEDGQFEEAVKLQSKYLEFMNAMFVEVNPIPIKEALEIAGFDTGYCRLPLCRADEKNIEYIKRLMKETGIIK